MKTIHILGIAFLFTALVFMLIAANFYPSSAAAQNLAAMSAPLQTTPTPAIDETTVIGSTDGIMLMGLVISLIVITPMLFRVKKEKDKTSRR